MLANVHLVLAKKSRRPAFQSAAANERPTLLRTSNAAGGLIGAFDSPIVLADMKMWYIGVLLELEFHAGR